MKKIDYEYISILITYLLLAIGLTFPIPKCPIYTHLGVFCPACGATRAVISLLKFDIKASLLYNPFVLYSFIFSSLYLLIESYNKILKKQVYFPSKLVLKIGIIILFLNCIIKNFLIFI